MSSIDPILERDVLFCKIRDQNEDRIDAQDVVSVLYK
jgi:hypothetical protein